MTMKPQQITDAQKVYGYLFLAADQDTGMVTVTLAEVQERVEGLTLYLLRKYLKYLEDNGKIKYLRPSGVAGSTYEITELTKGLTKTYQEDIPTPTKDPEAVEEADDDFGPAEEDPLNRLRWITNEAKYALNEQEDFVGQLMRNYLRLYHRMQEIARYGRN